MEQLADDKFSKIAEIKAEYKFELKGIEDEELYSKIEKERDMKLDEVLRIHEEKRSCALAALKKPEPKLSESRS